MLVGVQSFASHQVQVCVNIFEIFRDLPCGQSNPYKKTWLGLKLSPHQKEAPLAYDDKQLALRAVSYRGKLGGDGGMLNPHDKALPSVCPSKTCHLPAEVRDTVLFLSSARCERHRAVLYFPPRRSHDDAGQLLLSVHTVHLSQSCPSPPG